MFGLIAVLAFAQPLSAQELRLFSIGSGDLDGGYFAAARAICEVSTEPTANDFAAHLNLLQVQFTTSLRLAKANLTWPSSSLIGKSMPSREPRYSRLEDR